MFGAFLCVFVLSLSALPCCAFSATESFAEVEGAAGVPQSDADDDCCGVCSPFFSCGSCIHLAQPGNTVSLSLKEVGIISEPPQAAGDFILGSPAGRIWQPPKL